MNAYRILIFRGGALGDFILLLPAIHLLRKAWPDSFIELVGYPHIAEPALISGLINNIISIDSARIASYFVPHAVMPFHEIDFIRSFDLIIFCLHDPDKVVRSNLIRAGATHVLSIEPQVKSGHAIDHWTEPLEQLGIHGSGRETPRLDLPSDYRADGQQRLEQMGLTGCVIAIHPGSGSPKKNWPLPGFIALAAKVFREGIGQPLFLVGEADEAIARALRESQVRVPVLSGCSVLEVASVLSACRGYVGNDSGITHLSAALGVPTIALFGLTDPAVWAPRGPHVWVIRSYISEGLASIHVDDVLEQVFLMDMAVPGSALDCNYISGG